MFKWARGNKLYEYVFCRPAVRFHRSRLHRSLERCCFSRRPWKTDACTCPIRSHTRRSVILPPPSLNSSMFFRCSFWFENLPVLLAAFLEFVIFLIQFESPTWNFDVLFAFRPFFPAGPFPHPEGHQPNRYTTRGNSPSSQIGRAPSDLFPFAKLPWTWSACRRSATATGTSGCSRSPPPRGTRRRRPRPRRRRRRGGRRSSRRRLRSGCPRPRGYSRSSRAPPSSPSRAPMPATSPPCCSPTPSRSTTSRSADPPVSPSSPVYDSQHFLPLIGDARLCSGSWEVVRIRCHAMLLISPKFCVAKI